MKFMKTQQDLKLNQMKKVLIALDYDPSAKKVAELGYSLSQAMNADVILLHVLADNAYYSILPVSPIMEFGGFENYDFSQMANLNGLKKAAEYYLEKIAGHLGNQSIQIVIEEGDLADSILNTAKHFHANLIVMGSHSRRWLEQVLIGSSTEKVLRQTTIPLLVVPIKEHISK